MEASFKSESAQDARWSVAVVYPDEVQSHLIARALEAKGLRLYRFESARAAWEFLQHTPVSALIAPLEEPELGRLGLLKRVRSLAALERVEVVLVALAPSEQDLFDGYHAGATLVLMLDDPDLPYQVAKLFGG